MGLYAAPPRVPIVRFDTIGMDLSDQYDAWESNIGVFFDLAPAGDNPCGAPLHASIHACNLGSLVLGVTRAPTQRFERNSRRLAMDGMDHILIQVFLEGGGTTTSNSVIKAGDMLVIDMVQEHCMLNTDFANLTLVLPRSTDPRLSSLLAPLHCKALSSRAPMVRFLAAHMRALWDTVPEMNIQEANGAVRGTLGLMGFWLSQTGQLGEALPHVVSAALGQSIRRYIENHLADPLTPESLATTFRMSRSQLYRVFAPFDGVTTYIWERRLLRSMRMLSHPMHLGQQISTIAYQCGFSSEAHFSRAFKSRFKMTPGAVRRELLAGMAAGRNTGEDKNPLQRFPSWIRDLQKHT